METSTIVTFVALSSLMACGQNTSQNLIKSKEALLQPDEKIRINPKGKTIESRFAVPPGFERMEENERSFAYYLRNLPLKPVNSLVKLYNGTVKPNYEVYEAVIDLKIGNKDLHQCADAVMRLRAEYLFGQQQFDKIHFHFTNGFRVDYTEWMTGKRVVFNGNKTSWKQLNSPSNTPADFWSYLETVFMYAGTKSLAKELKPIKVDSLQIGDVFILGGSPGHAVIVVDLAINAKTKQKVFLLAQSYMPAQEIQVLKNPNNRNISPWYSAQALETLVTPEWTFNRNQLMRFE